MKFNIIIFLILISLNSQAYQFKVRAREHIEIHEVHTAASLDMYRGLSNTINMWWEKPYDNSIGFSFSPVIASLKEVNEDSNFGERITQQNIGGEYKYFPKIIYDSFYTRIGIGYSKLEVDKGNRKEFYGSYAYLGLGYEIPYEKFGMALEMAYRYANYQENLYVKSITPSIGFHFYKDI